MRSSAPIALLTASFVLLLACGSAEGDGDETAAGSGGASIGGSNAFGGGGNPSSTGGGGAAQTTGGAGAGGRSGSVAGSGGMSLGGVGGASLGGVGSGGASVGGSAAGFGGFGGANAGVGGSSGGTGGSSGGGSGGGTSVEFPPNCKCLNLGPPVCNPTGNVTFTLTKSASPSAEEQEAYDAITCAMTGATAYYNCNTSLTKKLNISYNSGVQTADGNINGSIRFGSDRGYMVCQTAMHEIGHTLGVGTAPNWPKLSVDGLFKGEAAIAQLRAVSGKADDVLHSDTQHFWPYGLNYASEGKTTADLVGHALIVQAMRKDLGL